MEYLFLLASLLYSLLVLSFITGWIRTPQLKTETNYIPKTSVTVVIPFRNEKANIPTLIDCLENQLYPKHLTTVYFVNDHSTDGGEELLLQSIGDNSHFSLLNSENEGKKHALRCAYDKVKSDLIITLDADCTVGYNWIMSIVQYYEKTGKEFIINPVQLSPAKTIWYKMQVLEFQTLIVSGAGAAANKRAIMCNGANLSFKTNTIKGLKDVLKSNISSGDDMFLMEHIKKVNSDNIGFLKNKDAVAKTEPLAFKQFFNQRARWASKAGSYSDFDILFSGVVVACVNFLLGFGLVLSLFSSALFMPTLFIFTIKLIVDFILLLVSSSFFKTVRYLWLVPIIALLYPYYVIASMLKGQLKQYSWKGR